jgi:CRP-like cAMP-binding protein
MNTMSGNKEQLLEQIKNLVPISELENQYQAQIVERSEVNKYRKGKYIFKQGDQDNFSFYLLDGQIEMLANGQLHNVIESGTDRARYAMAQLQPRQFSARAKTAAIVLQIDRKALDHMMVLAEKDKADEITEDAGMAIEVDEVDLSESDEVDWVTQMLQSELFSHMPSANIHQLFALLEPIEMKAGDVVINQGDPGEFYYIIQEGHCVVTRKPTPEGKDIKLAELKVGDNFGEEALISEATRNATVTMLTDGILMQLNKENFLELIKKPTIKSVNYEQAEKLVNDGAVWLDVRFQNEHQEANIEGSVNIPLNMLRMQMDKLDKDKKYVVNCDTDARSSTAAFLLAEYGFDACYLEGGLIKTPEAFSKKTQEESEPISKTPDKKEEKAVKQAAVVPDEQTDDEIDPEIRVQAINAELVRTNLDIRESKENRQALDTAQAKVQEEGQKKLLKEREKLEAEKKAAEAEVKRKMEEGEEKLERLKQEAKKRLLEEKEQLESIYAKNTEEMEKLQKIRQESEEQIKREKEKLEKESEEAKQNLEEAKRLKKDIEISRRNLEKEALKKSKQQEEMEKRIQAEAKAKLEEERRKLADQYERNSKEFEELQQEKAAAEAARKAAKEEAEKIIEEYKLEHERTRAEEEAKLQAERMKLEEEAKKIQDSIQEIKRAKREAEEARKAAQEEAERLRVKQEDTTEPKETRDSLKTEIEAVEKRLAQANRDLEDAQHAEKVTESAKEENEQDLARKKEEEEALQAQLAADVAAFEDEHKESETVTRVQSQQEHMKRIMERAKAAEEEAKGAADDLLADISSQLGGKD